MLDNDEPTTFEMNPLGNRQRLKPRESFLARQQVQPEPTSGDEASVRASMIVAELTHDEALASGEHTISDVALPAAASAVILPALSYTTPLPSLAMPVILLPREIHYPAVATRYYPPTETHTALPIASRRVRYLAVPVLAVLALVVLGGAVVPPEIEAQSPAADVSPAHEPSGTPRSSTIANEPEAPAEVIEEVIPAPRMVFAPRVRPAPQPLAKRVTGKRPIAVNSSSALGNLRPRKAW